MKHAIKRLPILRDGKVIGIVSRSDLVAAIARAPAMLV
jgi:CBS domain-containing protein